jgi:hypothetical protein
MSHLLVAVQEQIMIDDHDTNDAPEALLKAARRQPRPRKGCREAEARRLHEAGCKVVRLYGRRGELSGLTSQHGGLQVSRYMTASGVVIDVWPITGLDGPGRTPLCSNKVFGCELLENGALHLRSFRRGAWEGQLLQLAGSDVAAAPVVSLAARRH